MCMRAYVCTHTHVRVAIVIQKQLNDKFILMSNDYFSIYSESPTHLVVSSLVMCRENVFHGHGQNCTKRKSSNVRDTPVSERVTAFTYICIIYWLCIVIVHKDR